MPPPSEPHKRLHIFQKSAPVICQVTANYTESLIHRLIYVKFPNYTPPPDLAPNSLPPLSFLPKRCGSKPLLIAGSEVPTETYPPRRTHRDVPAETYPPRRTRQDVLTPVAPPPHANYTPRSNLEKRNDPPGRIPYLLLVQRYIFMIHSGR